MPAGVAITRYIGAKEGKTLKAYRDPVGIITGPFGATWRSEAFRRWYAANRGAGKLKLGDTFSETEANQILKLLLDEEYTPPVDRVFAAQPQNVKDGGYSMIYNCGAGALKWKWAQNIAAGALKRGCELWRTQGTTAKGRKLPGLVIRRQEEADLAEFNRWPSWFTLTAATPETHTYDVDIRWAQAALEKLGYSPGAADGIVGQRTEAATRRFQTDHGQLVVDGLIGPATLDALQRSLDLRSKATTTTATGAAPIAAGGAESQVDVSQTDGLLSSALLWGGLAIIVVGLAWLAWTYRDELVAAARKL